MKPEKIHENNKIVLDEKKERERGKLKKPQKILEYH